MLQSAQGHMPHPAPARPQVPAAQSPHMQPTAASPRDQNNIDPAISGTAMMGAPPATPPQPDQEAGDESPKGYGKRPLSTSKRAAQNRAAQVCAITSPCDELLTWCIESIPPAQGNLHSQAGGTGEAV